jgi:putative ABC transport system permease protein
VIGVAGEVSDSHDPGVPAETFYLPLAQNAASPAAEKIYLMVRTAGDPLALIGAVQHAAARVDGALALYDPAAMDRYYSDSLGRERVGALFMLAFGLFALALAALGVYGVVAFGVAQRTPEFGIRIALGAQAHDIVVLVLRQGVGLVGAGLAAGAAAAWVVNRVVASLLADTAVAEPRVLAVAVALIAAVTVVASWLPAHRACGIDPVKALSD